MAQLPPSAATAAYGVGMHDENVNDASFEATTWLMTALADATAQTFSLSNLALHVKAVMDDVCEAHEYGSCACVASRVRMLLRVFKHLHASLSDAETSEFQHHLTQWLRPACEAGDDALLRLLLNAGASPADAAPLGLRPLHVCATAACAKTLIESGSVDVNAYAANHVTPLHMQVRSLDDHIVDVLLDAGADVDARSTDLLQNSPLHVALADSFLSLTCAGRGACICRNVAAMLCAQVRREALRPPPREDEAHGAAHGRRIVGAVPAFVAVIDRSDEPGGAAGMFRDIARWAVTSALAEDASREDAVTLGFNHISAAVQSRAIRRRLPVLWLRSRRRGRGSRPGVM